VPDFENSQLSLAGSLSRNTTLKNVKYIGPLSRAIHAKSTNEIKAPILYLLSGLEPQRSILEKQILLYHSKHPHQAILIRGTYHAIEKITPQSNLIVYEMCNTKQLQSLVSACKYIVCRSGYSSIMDIITWQKNALLIPTPGQYEQEYLAQYLKQKKWFYCCHQNNFLQFKESDLNDFKCPSLPALDSNFEKLLDTL
jgi:predicted glycosyltransferase